VSNQAKKKPGIAGIVLGIVLMVFGPVIGVVLIVVTAVAATADIRDAQIFDPGDGNATLELSGGQEMGLWVNYDGYGNCRVLDQAGGILPFNDSGYVSQQVNNYSLAATFTPPVDGSYVIECSSSNANLRFKVAPTLAGGKLAGGIVAGVLAIIVLFLGGLAWLIVTLVRRSNWNKRNAPPAPGYGPPGASPQGYGPGYVPPQYPTS